MIVYPDRLAAETETILLGLVRRGFVDAFTVHAALVQEFELALFGIYQDLRDRAVDDLAGAAGTLYDYLEEANQTGVVARDIFFEIADRSSSSALDLFLQMLNEAESSQRNSTIPINLPIPFLLAVDLLYQASVVRRRLFNSVNQKMQRSFARNLVFANAPDSAAYGGQDPVDEAVFGYFRELATLVRRELGDSVGVSRRIGSEPAATSENDRFNRRARARAEEIVNNWSFSA